MCTLTAIPVFSQADNHGAVSLRIMFNRDEQRTRPPSLAPALFKVASGRAVYPIDPASGGTWLGINDSGLAVCLLNRSGPGLAYGTSLRSRGEIVARLLHADSLSRAAEMASLLRASDHAPFRLACFSRTHAVMASSDGETLQVADPADIREPIMLTSSGLGDAIVERPRSEAFATLMLPSPEPASQARFHDWRCPDAGHLGVMMHREDARTVSRCTITLSDRESTLHYERLDASLCIDAQTTHTLALITRPTCTSA